jgi:hypothetical protein
VEATDKIIFSYTSIISTSTADAVGECYTSLFSTYTYMENKSLAFGSSTNFMQAFLQNLLGNAIAFNNLYS